MSTSRETRIDDAPPGLGGKLLRFLLRSRGIAQYDEVRSGASARLHHDLGPKAAAGESPRSSLNPAPSVRDVVHEALRCYA